MSHPLEAILIGAGNRGAEAYGAYGLAHPDQIRFVAVAEPNGVRRGRFAEAHGIPPERQFHTWEDLLAQRQLAHAGLVCTQDQLHVAPAVAALEAGYDVLLEKPMATTPAECVHLVHTAERTERLLRICHVLRYTAFFATVHDIVTSGRLGKAITVEHRENVAYWHMAHAYVRGNWRNTALASPMILAKCCHDLDLLYWCLGPCTRLSSFGSLIHYRPGNAPSGAPERCTDGCPHEAECPWFAPRLYLDLVPLPRIGRRSSRVWERGPTSAWASASLVLDHPTDVLCPPLARLTCRLIPSLDAALDYRGWPISVISEDTSPEARREALATGPYGRCVYHCDNDVVDHQVVNMQFASGASAALVMHGHSHRDGRTLRFDSTRATLRGHYYPGQQEIQIHDHLTGKVDVIRPTLGAIGATGHGSGDEGVMAAFICAARGSAQALTDARESLESHLMGFAAEEARAKGIVVDMDDLRRRAEAMASVDRGRQGRSD